jgi:hypothetical protein
VKRPAQIPHDDGKPRETSGAAGQSKEQVTPPFPAAPQVTDLALVTLSRWRYGFESRWDYPGQRLRRVRSVPRHPADIGRGHYLSAQ